MTEKEMRNPNTEQPKPPYPKQEQQPPGQESQMRPLPDFGEESYKGSARLQGRVAVITGGDSGIGRAVALAYAREGADVLIAYLNEHQDAQETARVVSEAGRRAVTLSGDISDIQHCRTIVERAVQEFGRIDVLVNNAAFQRTHESIDQIPADEFEYTFRTNVFAMFYLCQLALPHMKPGAAIINTTSIQAYQPSPELLAYAATKGAIVNFTKGLAQLAIKQGVRVNAVAPGPIWTPLIPSTMPTEKTTQFGKDTPMGRAGQPAELAPVFVFLASQDSSYIVGEVIGVTGGELLP